MTLRDRWFGGRRSGGFTLQWHLTNACDNACRHCYDRSSLPTLSLHQAEAVVDDLARFCAKHTVRGHVSFTGGNPLLYPHFLAVYGRAATAGLSLAILGNPTEPERLAEIVSIRKPAYYQVSLEGLEPHNDHIRGPHHFRRTLAFLDELHRRGIRGHVMLTLTRDNLDEVLPLAAILRGRVRRFSFNRLAPVGSGAALALPTREAYNAFLGRYLDAALVDPTLALKDNLLSAWRWKRGFGPLRGCTGHGCGAAFNFVALLPNGEVHACRKLPSPIGDVSCNSIDAIYSSSAARRYRRGPEACRRCPIHKACRGCLAVTHGLGGRPLVDLDPHCCLL